MSRMSTGCEISKERTVHGAAWGNFHGGYFSDPSVARPLIEKVCEAVSSSQPEVIVELGGGTGYLLGALREQCPGLSAQLVNLDLSGKQLCESAHDCITGYLPASRFSGNQDCLTRMKLLPLLFSFYVTFISATISYVRPNHVLRKPSVVVLPSISLKGSNRE